jgi:alcohol dehydrogenase
MASTGLGACHVIGHALGGRFDIPHGVALTMVLPGVLEFSQPVSMGRMCDISFALGVGDTAASADRNASAAVLAIAELASAVGMNHRLGDFGIGPAEFEQIAVDALDDEVLANAPLQPSADDIKGILAGCS